MKNPVRFSDAAFRRSHGRAPRGVGLWAFAFGVGNVGAEFAPLMLSLTEAKAWARDRARQLAADAKVHPTTVLLVDVLP